MRGSDKQYFFEDDNYYFLPVTEINTEHYEGSVYNVETEDNTYTAGVVVHNSEMREMYKSYFRFLHPEEEPEELRAEHID